jgi:hypothetical protein
MLVEVNWTYLEGNRHPLWADNFCLYAYLHPERDWLLYVGKADYSTVRQRLHGDHKADLFDDIQRRYGIDDVRVLHGELHLEEGRRRSSELLADVESLLIMRLQPFGNIQSRRSRITRPGLRVHCVGDWPFKRFRFHDTDWARE